MRLVLKAEVLLAVAVAIARGGTRRRPSPRLRRIGLAGSNALACRTRRGGGGNPIGATRGCEQSTAIVGTVGLPMLVAFAGGFQVRVLVPEVAEDHLQAGSDPPGAKMTATTSPFVLDWHWSAEEPRL
jgi:hypothetical protein